MLKFALPILILSAIAHASDHLEPEDSPFSEVYFPEYMGLVLEYLDAGYDENIKVRLIAMPSFSPEYTVGIKRADKKYSIFYEAPVIQLWEYQMLIQMDEREVLARDSQGDTVKDAELEELRKKLPKNPMNIPRKQCEREIPRVLAKEIQFIWQEMLYDTRYNREGGYGRDGVNYHFSAPVDGRVLAGKIWSPEQNHRTGKLVEVSDLMMEYCLDTQRNASKLIKKVRVLHAELGAAPPAQMSTQDVPAANNPLHSR